MKKIPVTKYEYVIEPEEVKILKVCLDYCYHRLKYHDESGIQGQVDIFKLDKMRYELR